MYCYHQNKGYMQNQILFLQFTPEVFLLNVSHPIFVVVQILF